MIFDLSSPGRKNVVRVVFGFLAFLFAGSFIFLGIGTEGGFNPLDSLFGDNNSTSGAFEQQIEDAEESVEKNPDDPKAISELVLLRTQSGASQLEVDEATQQPTLTEESRAEFEKAATAWQDYLALEPKEVDAATARAAASAYQFLEDINGLIEAAQALAESEPSGTNLGALATYLYLDLQIEKADKARDKAIAASNGETAKLVEQQLEQFRKNAIKEEKRIAKLPKSEQGSSAELSDPFGELSPTAPGTTPEQGAVPAP